MTVGVSTAEEGETIEENSIANEQATVGISTAKGGETAKHSIIIFNFAPGISAQVSTSIVRGHACRHAKHAHIPTPSTELPPQSTVDKRGLQYSYLGFL